jgi:NOL1/NOP2/sun family putative RNA methylase
METQNNYPPNPKFVERIKLLLNDETDVSKFFESANTVPKKSIRVNTLKITPDNIIKELNEKSWKLTPIDKDKSILRIESELLPGELGKTTQHILGYYYVQEITSMMPVLALDPTENDFVLDSCASPGSKTTQIASLMKNKGVLIANDVNIGRISILSANLERCGVTNAIVTRHDANELAQKLKKINLKFDKILLDAPCSGEGNLRVSKRTTAEWSINLIRSLSKKQKRMASALIELVKPNGTLVYSTCTYAPEENEEVIQYLLDNFDIEIEDVTLPIKSRPGRTQWNGKEFSQELKKCKRFYHQDNDMEGFFLCKIKKLSDKIKTEENTQENIEEESNDN